MHPVAEMAYEAVQVLNAVLSWALLNEAQWRR